MTKAEMAEIITQLGFYTGWPKAWAAFNMAKEVYAEPAANVVREKLNGCTVIIAAQPFFKSKNAFSFKSRSKKIKMEAILARTIVLGLDILSPSDICGDLKRCVRNESEFLCAKLCGMEKVCDAFSMQD